MSKLPALLLLLATALTAAADSPARVDADSVVWRATLEADQQRLQQIAEQLSASLPVSGTMVQQKHMAILEQPLQSKGEFLLEENGDIDWSVTEPFPVLYQVRDDRILRTLDGEQLEISARTEPSVYGFFQIVSKLFELKLDGLHRFFTLQVPAEGLGEPWQLRLQPNNDRLASAIAAIVVSGQQGQMSRVTVREPNGDFSQIEFIYRSKKP
ncbi:outer membrane lipoprotein carrier protein LolA [Gilvimarinus sp. SDUM040013]|uniref:Outer membrane lipoprotein carrier protein LolA n=1 Tax=Gilvimarinus gilvus TaxID=3058038 RepID=A0ABU4S1P6_9GAMM|nr:outer membrane lipoprotein carrier protein LolA [Gilvimarinus sp. SDUM040013]MDO3387789.1 outer membrane lipoprotein carrier protein LolA [Gilvimarinus sp. SDUM040013]MDX6851068.1 outer membrane lipoprotein carrier protein LolA [Gilvimarinus sp. SDUM040013]